MFLLEREHVVRAPFLRSRTDDFIWLLGTLFVVVTFGALSIWGVRTAHAELSAEDGQCRIGLAKLPAYLLLVFDASINAGLTLMFVMLLRPFHTVDRSSGLYDGEGTGDAGSRTGRWRRIARRARLVRFESEQGTEVFSASIRKVLWKNVAGSSLIFLASAANLSVFFAEHGQQLAWVCLVACMADGEFERGLTKDGTERG